MQSPAPDLTSRAVHGSHTPRVIRGCGWIVDDSVNQDCVHRQSAFSATIQYCTCDQDGCNTGSSVSLMHPLVALSVALVTGIRTLL